MVYTLVEELWDGAVYELVSDSGQKYRVALSKSNPYCTCHDYQYRKRKTKTPCKHMDHIRHHAVTQTILQMGDWSCSWDE